MASPSETLAQSLPAPPALSHLPLSWNAGVPGLVCGITTRGSDAGFDVGLRGREPVGEVMARWDALLALPGMNTVVHALQLHGSVVRMHRDLPPGLFLSPPVDGHLTTQEGVLLTVSVADCVPVFMVSESPRAVALLHAGWRGVAGGILDAGLAAFRHRLGVGPGALHLFLGPSISGRAYEVGPEVHRALGLADPGQAALLDLRAVLAERAGQAGVSPERIEISALCTLADARFHSHRGGDAGRQVAFLGLAAGDVGATSSHPPDAS
jgi:polyphenol oxidase